MKIQFRVLRYLGLVGGEYLVALLHVGVKNHFRHLEDYEFRDEFLIRYFTMVMVLLVNMIWSLIMFNEIKTTKIICGLLSGFVFISLAFTTRFIKLEGDIIAIVVVAGVFILQIVYWEILAGVGYVGFKA